MAAFKSRQFPWQSLQCSWTESGTTCRQDLRQPDLPYSHFRQSLKTVFI